MDTVLINIATTLSGGAHRILVSIGDQFGLHHLDPIGVLAIVALIALVWRFAL